MDRFRDRADAGRFLAEHLSAPQHEVVVLALPRGGVPVALPVAERFDAPLDVILVRKLGVPGHEELAMGAIAEGGWQVANESVIHSAGVPDRVIDDIAARERAELKRRARLYRGDRPAVSVDDKEVILIDDGLATGATMRAAAIAVRHRSPRKVTIAVPVAAASTCEELGSEVDEVVCAFIPPRLWSVGEWYDDFRQVTDDEVRALLEQAARLHPIQS